MPCPSEVLYVPIESRSDEGSGILKHTNLHLRIQGLLVLEFVPDHSETGFLYSPYSPAPKSISFPNLLHNAHRSIVMNTFYTGVNYPPPKGGGFCGIPHDYSFLFHRTVHITRKPSFASLPSTGINSDSSYRTL